ADAAGRYRLDELAQDDLWRGALRGRGRLEEPVGPGGLDAAGRHAVHADVQRAELHRELLAEHADRGVAGAARRVQRNRLLGRAGDVDDAAAAAPSQVRNRRLRAADVTEQLAVDRVDEGLVRQVDERPEGGSPGVVDQDVEAAQALGRLLDDGPATVETA